jgi:dTDP-4-amino-4,6-dideoxygalactose transaminase
VAIPHVDVKAQYEPLIPELERAFRATLDSGRFIFGPEVEGFEREAAEYLGTRQAIGVANGTDAIVLVLDALGIGAGDEVICPSFTFYATAEAIARVGATPVFAEIDPVSLNLDVADVADRITPRTKAIMPVHLFGRPAAVAELQELGLPVIEDSAQAFGAGGIASSIASTFSFFPTKNLFCIGDGGLIAVNEDELGERIRMLRFHGSKSKKTFEYVGYNSRLDEIQAAILRVLLPHLDDWSDGRRAAGRLYEEAGLGSLVTLPVRSAGCDPAWHLYVIRHPAPDELAAKLGEAGIGTKAYYRTPVHRQPAMTRWGADTDLPVTDELAATHLAIPMSPVLGREGVEEVVAAVRASCGALSPAR